MAIFSRRTLQRLVDENSRFLSASQIKSHIRRLNSKHPNDCLSAEWEIALLNAFGRLGAVQHEPNLGGRCRPDIKFTHSEDVKATFIADVATVSDVGLDAQNPAHA